MRERDIAKELKRQVKAAGGDYRKLKWVGRRNAPDLLIMFPWLPGGAYVETKRPGLKARAAQEREHSRMRLRGLRVYLVTTTDELAALLPRLAAFPHG